MYDEKMTHGYTRQSTAKAVKKKEKKRREEARIERRVQRRKDFRAELTDNDRRAVWMKYGRICYLCGHRGANTIDHVIPLIKGGTNDIENLRPAHKRCNKAKGAKILVLPEELKASGW